MEKEVRGEGKVGGESADGGKGEERRNHVIVRESGNSGLTMHAGSLAEPLAEFPAVPHQQLLLWLHGPDRVEEDVVPILACHQVLVRQGPGRVYVSHPVAMVHVIAVNKVMQLSFAVDLGRKTSMNKPTM